MDATSPLPDRSATMRAPLAVALGVVRVGAVLVELVVGTAAVLVASLVPGRIRGRRPAVWVAWALGRMLLAVISVRLEATHAERVRDHHGFVFFNHVSFLDAPVVMALGPVRFLATAGVRRLPLLGWIAARIGTVFVNRGDGESRQTAREGLRSAVRRSPTPVAVAPEGGIGLGPGVGPFRHGAFEVAAEADAPIRLVALAYPAERLDVWHDGEWLLAPLWRLCARTGPFVVRATALDPVLDPAASAPDVLAREAQARLDAVLLDEARRL